MKRKLKPVVPATPDYAKAHERMDSMGLRVVSYQHCPPVGGWHVPMDIIGADGKTLIVWREADKSYSVDGWESWHDGMFSGRQTSLGSALAWVQRARDIRAGIATDFLGA